ncbi:uncharacterized protein LOC143914927 [Arctopsyche grandis]|uniref:uncharacterized protein LOC143914927 n=1 Tax=Arctopsyche grandis TaxID=121162 RepID=UPI00406D9C4E
MADDTGKLSFYTLRNDTIHTMAFKLLIIGVLVSCARSSVIPSAAVAVTPLKADYDPNPQYAYAYDVQDSITGDFKSQYETRNGDVVKGSYSLFDPDGTKRTVDYTADPINGFNAVVKKEPIATGLVTHVVGNPAVAAVASPIVAASVPAAVVAAPATVASPAPVIAVAAPAPAPVAAVVAEAPAPIVAAEPAIAAPVPFSLVAPATHFVPPYEAKAPAVITTAGQFNYPSHTVAIASPLRVNNVVYPQQYIPNTYPAFPYGYPSNFITSYIKDQGNVFHKSSAPPSYATTNSFSAPLVTKVAAPINYAYPQYFTQYNQYPYDLQGSYSAPVLSKYNLPYTQWF